MWPMGLQVQPQDKYSSFLSDAFYAFAHKNANAETVWIFDKDTGETSLSRVI